MPFPVFEGVKKNRLQHRHTQVCAICFFVCGLEECHKIEVQILHSHKSRKILLGMKLAKDSSAIIPSGVCHNRLQSLRQLVGTRSGLHSTTYAFQSGNHICRTHPRHQFGNALQVPMTPTDKMNGFHDAIFHLQFDLATTSPCGLIHKIHAALLLFGLHIGVNRLHIVELF